MFLRTKDSQVFCLGRVTDGKTVEVSSRSWEDKEPISNLEVIVDHNWIDLSTAIQEGKVKSVRQNHITSLIPVNSWEVEV